MPDIRSLTGERECFERSSDFGVKTTSGVGTDCIDWRRIRWKNWAAVVALQTCMLSSAAGP